MPQAKQFSHPEARAFSALKDLGERAKRRVLCDAMIARSDRILISFATIYNADFTPLWIWGSKVASPW